MIAQPHRTDEPTAQGPDAPRVRPAEPVPPTPASARAVNQDPSGFGFAEPAVQPTGVRAAAPSRRPGRAPQRPPRWPHVAAAVALPAAGAAGFLAAVLSSAVPIQILTYTVIGSVVIIKVAGPVRAVAAALARAVAKVGR